LEDELDNNGGSREHGRRYSRVFKMRATAKSGDP